MQDPWAFTAPGSTPDAYRDIPPERVAQMMAVTAASIAAIQSIQASLDTLDAAMAQAMERHTDAVNTADHAFANSAAEHIRRWRQAFDTLTEVNDDTDDQSHPF